MKQGIIFLIGLLLMVGYLGTRAVKSVQFNQNCGGYLKRAADANTVETAKEELSKAISYIEANNLTQGYTSVMWQTPNEDLGFWYKNLKSSETELSKVKHLWMIYRTEQES